METRDWRALATAAKQAGKEAETVASGKLRIFVSDGCPLVREGWMRVIDRESDLECCGAAACAATTLQGLSSIRPHLLVMDLRLAGGDGLAFIRTTRADFPSIGILVASELSEDLYAGRALAAGAVGFVRKLEPVMELVTAIRTCVAGELYLDRKLATRLIRTSTGPRPNHHRSGIERLSNRELEVFRHVGDGLGTKEIASTMALSAKTVETYRNSIKRKLGLSDASALLRYCIRWALDQAPANDRN